MKPYDREKEPNKIEKLLDGFSNSLVSGEFTQSIANVESCASRAVGRAVMYPVVVWLAQTRRGECSVDSNEIKDSLSNNTVRETVGRVTAAASLAVSVYALAPEFINSL